MSSDFSPVSPSGFESELGKLADDSDLDAHAALDAEADDVHGAKTYADTVASGRVAADSLWVGMGDLVPTRGGPTTDFLAGNGYYASWAMGDSSLEGISAYGRLADHGWTTFDAQVWLVALTDNAGDAFLRFRYEPVSLGGSLGLGTGAAVAVTSPGTTGQVFGWDAVSGGTVADVLGLAIRREGSDPADTLTGDVGVLGVLLTKAS